MSPFFSVKDFIPGQKFSARPGLEIKKSSKSKKKKKKKNLSKECEEVKKERRMNAWCT